MPGYSIVNPPPIHIALKKVRRGIDLQQRERCWRRTSSTDKNTRVGTSHTPPSERLQQHPENETIIFILSVNKPPTEATDASFLTASQSSP
ncbi:hypothetical protein NPIL_216281 [Nephila pilipes]|uniref:Uncharacterized protein n=1 Tax=Nephila pilipes TaxID=299642 RepID=A0A8X6NEF3_NEPPI|nr:hypothetical protein NPIL_216281 [Nephila pilipes]